MFFGRWSGLLCFLFDVRDGVTDGADLFGVFIGNRDREFFFEFHDQFDSIQRICAEIIGEAGSGNDFGCIDSKFVLDDFDYFEETSDIVV